MYYDAHNIWTFEAYLNVAANNQDADTKYYSMCCFLLNTCVHAHSANLYRAFETVFN